jgi:hypothetical protein
MITASVSVVGHYRTTVTRRGQLVEDLTDGLDSIPSGRPALFVWISSSAAWVSAAGSRANRERIVAA